MAIWPNSPYPYLRNHEGYGATSNGDFYLLTEYIKKHFKSRTGENFSAMSPGHWAHLRLLKKVSLKKGFLLALSISKSAKLDFLFLEIVIAVFCVQKIVGKA